MNFNLKVVFISNFFNHHQQPFSMAMDELTNGNYRFIAMSQMSDARKKMGWELDSVPSFVIQYSDNEKQCNELIFNADVVICACGYEQYVKTRLVAKKLVFMYSERWHKQGFSLLKLIKHIPVNFMKYNRFKNCYMLCSSSFTAYDCSKSLSFLNKCYKWGYFPEFVPDDNINRKMELKHSDQTTILFVSRLIEWKHPELPLKVIKQLGYEGIDCHLTMIGNGPMKPSLMLYIYENNLQNNVTFIDAVSPQKVREYMDQSQIFLFTSDKNEGWGAVLNEAMNSACAVVSSSAIGSTSFLLKDQKNGYIYQDGDFSDLYAKTKALILDRLKRERLGIDAYKTISTQWNAQEAAKRFIRLSTNILNGEHRFLFADGPCSKAYIQKDSWYKNKGKG